MDWVEVVGRLKGVVTDTAASSFTIYLTKAVKVSLAIAWFIVG